MVTITTIKIKPINKVLITSGMNIIVLRFLFNV